MDWQLQPPPGVLPTAVITYLLLHLFLPPKLHETILSPPAHFLCKDVPSDLWLPSLVPQVAGAVATYLSPTLNMLNGLNKSKLVDIKHM